LGNLGGVDLSQLRNIRAPVLDLKVPAQELRFRLYDALAAYFDVGLL
jgi:hypothetical protein